MGKRAATKDPIDANKLTRAFEKRGYFQHLPAPTVESLRERIALCAAERWDPRCGLFVLDAVQGEADEQAFADGADQAKAWLSKLAAKLELQPHIELHRWSHETIAFKIDGQVFGAGEGFPGGRTGLRDRPKNSKLRDALMATECVFTQWAQARPKWIGCAAVAADRSFGFILDPVGDGDLCLLNTLSDDLSLADRWQAIIEWKFIYGD